MNYEETLKELKNAHGTVYTITAPLNDDETEFSTVFLKKPNRAMHTLVGKLAVGSDPLRAVEAALKGLYIGGDKLESIMDNEDALMSCEGAIVDVMKKKEAVLKKN